jgi:hypothetical protein
MYPALWAAGVFTVNWWNVRNGIGTVTTVAGQTDYNDFGLFSSGTCLQDGVTCEPALNTPFAPYHAIDLVDMFADTGDQLIQVNTGDPLVKGHAVRRDNGDTPSSAVPTVHTYLNGGTGVTTSRTGTATAQTLAAYSLTVLTVKPKLPLPLPPAAGAPTVGAVTDTTATVTWPAAKRGLLAVAGYDVYLQDAGASRLVGQPTATTLNLTGLRPGTRYTVTVVARDKIGLTSWSTSAIAFVTGTPAQSACAVTFTDASDWGNGYVASVDVTNTGTEVVDGWTLAFSLRRPWQSFGGGWNATWTADGASLSATNVDWNASIAPGASINVGFVGNYGGPNVLPNLFTLNGTLCTTR